MILGFLAAGHSLLLWLDRQAHGPGLFFAGVEIFGFLALLSMTAGGAAPFGARALLRRRRVEESVLENPGESSESSRQES